MAYPDSKETFRTVSEDDLLKIGDQNNMGGCVERIQDTLGLNPEGAFASVVARLNDVDTKAKSIELTVTSQAGQTIGIATPYTKNILSGYDFVAGGIYILTGAVNGYWTGSAGVLTMNIKRKIAGESNINISYQQRTQQHTGEYRNCFATAMFQEVVSGNGVIEVYYSVGANSYYLADGKYFILRIE